MTALAREWFDKAADFSVAASLLRRKKPPADIICFHSRQAAEKCLKALLQHHLVPFTKTHDLEGLLQEAAKVVPTLALLGNDAKLLSDYAIGIQVRQRPPGRPAKPWRPPG